MVIPDPSLNATEAEKVVNVVASVEVVASLNATEAEKVVNVMTSEDCIDVKKPEEFANNDGNDNNPKNTADLPPIILGTSEENLFPKSKEGKKKCK